MTKRLLILACLSMVMPVLTAAVIMSPVAASSSVGHYPGCCEIERTIDQSGLLTPFVSGVTDFNAYIAGNPLHEIAYQNEWFAPLGVLSATIIYDLGAIYSATGIAFWNEDATGTREFRLDASTDAEFTSPILLGTFNPTDHPINQNYFADVWGGGAVNVRYFRLAVLGVEGTDYVSIGEVAFRVNAIPEPGTMGLLGIGLAGLALVARRRR